MPPRPTLLPLIGLDTEGTGLDIFHGARPYFITTCDEEFNQTFWEFDVEPYTRDPIISEEDLLAVRSFLTGKRLVLQNTKYDFHALKETPGLDLLEWWDWKLVYDTLIAAHLLGSNKPKDLTTLALMELGVDISPYEDALRDATLEALKIVKDKFPKWRRARRGLSDMPTAKEKVWKFDSWIPRRVAQELGYPEDHPWWTVLSDYGNADSATVLQVFLHQRERIQERGYWKIYLKRLEILPIAADMEEHGITANESRFRELEEKYKKESERAGRICKNIAWGYDHPDEEGNVKPYDLQLPKSGKNKSLETFVFDVLKLPVVAYTDKGFPALNKDSISTYLETLPPTSAGFHFVRTLGAKRKRDTNLSYMEGYERFWLPAFPGAVDPETGAGWYVLHPSLNPTGTDTLRWSSSNPNEQNISKQGSICMSCFREDGRLLTCRRLTSNPTTLGDLGRESPSIQDDSIGRGSVLSGPSFEEGPRAKGDPATAELGNRGSTRLGDRC